MPLKYKFSSKDDVPEEHVDLYVERDGSYFLDVDGAVDFDKFKEFRTNNTRLFDENKKLKNQIERVGDLERAATLMAVAGDLPPDELQKALKKGNVDVDKLVESRTKAMKDEFDNRVRGVSEENSRLTNRLSEVEINQAVLEEASKKGLKPTARTDIVSRARQVFRIHEGKVTAFEADGKSVRYGKNGVDPLSVEEWMESQLTEATHLFEGSAGSGASGSKGGSGGLGNLRKVNPWTKEHWNVTKQMAIKKENPDLASKMAESAGRKLPGQQMQSLAVR